MGVRLFEKKLNIPPLKIVWGVQKSKIGYIPPCLFGVSEYLVLVLRHDFLDLDYGSPCTVLLVWGSYT